MLKVPRYQYGKRPWNVGRYTGGISLLNLFISLPIYAGKHGFQTPHIIGFTEDVTRQFYPLFQHQGFDVSFYTIMSKDIQCMQFL